MIPEHSVRGVVRDDRGAILVAGIFMCTCLVGALWYLAGVGDAILYRERLQEAADATAFSSAAVHARGMNLIVVLNLLMAVVLGVRVILKVTQLILVVAAVTFAIIGFFVPPFASVASLCAKGAKQLENVIRQTRKPINETLKGLSKTQTGIAAATPALAVAGSAYVGQKYADGPRVAYAFAANTGVIEGLPTEEGSVEKLCKEAGRSVPELVGWAIAKSTGLGDGGARNNDKKNPGGWLSNAIGAVAATSPLYFCEMGSAKGSVQLDGFFTEQAERYCEDPAKAEDSRVANADAEWTQACAEAGVTCGGAGPDGQLTVPGRQTGTTSVENQTQLDRLRAKRDDAIGARSSLPRREEAWRERGRADKRAGCTEDETNRMKKEHEKLTAEVGATNEHSDGKGMTPKKVKKGFKNGARGAQLYGVASGDSAILKRSSELVRVAAADDGQRMRSARTDIAAEYPSVSQAEYFFDCSGKWGGDDCNGHEEDDQDAMWHIRWRPRLRRYDGRLPLAAMSAAKVGYAAAERALGDLSSEAARDQPGLLVKTLLLKKELAEAAVRRPNVTRGIH